MQIRIITEADIPQWQALSLEYDRYVEESVPDLSEWYGGNDYSPAFTFYMKAKITQQEAFMAVDCNDSCLGVIAFSKKNNRITFFAVSHHADFNIAANALFDCAFTHLNTSEVIYINEIISSSEWIKLHRQLYFKLGFMFYCNSIENGVPVKTLAKSPSCA